MADVLHRVRLPIVSVEGWSCKSTRHRRSLDLLWERRPSSSAQGLAHCIHGLVVRPFILRGVWSSAGMSIWTWTVSSLPRFLGMRMTSSTRPLQAQTVPVSMSSSGVGSGPLSVWFPGMIPPLVRASLAGFFIIAILDIFIPSFLVVLISSLAPISLLQFEISHQPA